MCDFRRKIHKPYHTLSLALEVEDYCALFSETRIRNNKLRTSYYALLPAPRYHAACCSCVRKTQPHDGAFCYHTTSGTLFDHGVFYSLKCTIPLKRAMLSNQFKIIHLIRLISNFTTQRCTRYSFTTLSYTTLIDFYLMKRDSLSRAQ